MLLPSGEFLILSIQFYRIVCYAAMAAASAAIEKKHHGKCQYMLDSFELCTISFWCRTTWRLPHRIISTHKSKHVRKALSFVGKRKIVRKKV